MASAVNLSGQITLRQTICSIPFKQSPQFVQKNMKIKQQGICLRRLTPNKKFSIRRLNLVKSSLADDSDMTINELSTASMIEKIYACINDKRLKELDEYISNDCYFEDCSFVSPIQGKKEVMHFYQQLTTGMGHNVKFCIENVCQDKEFTAGANWHMEWKGTQIPFTRGCSFYEFSQEGEGLIIKKARVVIESPIKLGGITLILLKNVTTIFDDYPKFAEWFLKSPYVIAQFLIWIYTRLLAPIINPLLRGYIRILNIMVQWFAFALSILLRISKKYFQ